MQRAEKPCNQSPNTVLKTIRWHVQTHEARWEKQRCDGNTGEERVKARALGACLVLVLCSEMMRGGWEGVACEGGRAYELETQEGILRKTSDQLRQRVLLSVRG